MSLATPRSLLSDFDFCQLRVLLDEATLAHHAEFRNEDFILTEMGDAHINSR
jgi:hypothetical protein